MSRDRSVSDLRERQRAENGWNAQSVRFEKVRFIEFQRVKRLFRLYDVESEILQARGVSREALFIPIGWESEKRVNLLQEGAGLPDEIPVPQQK